PLSLIILDIDHFKKINDTYGHITGDSAIKHIVKIINDGIRSVDIFCRYGGEEFALLLPETEPDSAFLIAERLCRSLANSPFFTGTEQITITASFGVSGISPGNDGTLDTILKNADSALYEAKRSGRNRVKIME
ncbi:MAG TPA: GGDEF domain-containing protein, partial [Spirochaetota bacterium]|nr:GGDEF domain-containing protein [Spirochaetota bacterium]